MRFDRLIHLPGHDDAHLQRVTDLQDRLIEKPTVEANDDHHVGPASLAHQGDHPAEHIHDGVARMALRAPPAKDGVHTHARPDHLQGLKALALLIGRLHTMPFRRLVVIHHHGIDGRLDHPGPCQLQPPDIQLIENRAEGSTGDPRNCFEKPFHGMRRRHVGAGRFDRGGIPRIRLQVIKIPQVPTRPIEQETEELLEEGPKGEALAVCAEMAKGLLQERRDLDLREVADEEGSAAEARQGIGGGVDLGNPVGCLGLRHRDQTHWLGDWKGGVGPMSLPDSRADDL